MISADDVRRIAALAKLRLDDSELESMAVDLGRILEHVERLRALSLDHPEEPERARAPLREDVVTATLDRELVAANAPRFERGHFIVPPVLGGEE